MRTNILLKNLSQKTLTLLLFQLEARKNDKHKKNCSECKIIIPI